MEVGRGEIVSGKKEILWAGLGIDAKASALRPADLLNRLFARDVNNEDRCIDELGERNRPVGRFALGDLRACGAVELGRNIAGAL